MTTLRGHHRRYASRWIVALTIGTIGWIGADPPLAAQEPAASKRRPLEVNTGLDPTFLPSSFGADFQQAKFAGGRRLRAALFNGTHHFGGDYFNALIPVLDLASEQETVSDAIGLGDIRLSYFRLFRILAISETIDHGVGLTLQLDTASEPQLGSGTTSLEPFYAITTMPTSALRLVFVARYLRDVGAGFATPIVDTVLLSPVAIIEMPNALYAALRFNAFIDTLSPPNTFTGRITGGKIFAQHYNLALFYEFPLTEESRELNIQARFGLRLLYQF